MNLLLITFSLRNSSRDYSQFFVELRGRALQWWHFIEQTAIVATYYDEDAYSEFLRPHIETTDALLVTKISPHQFNGWLPRQAWEWLHQVSNHIEEPTLPLPPPQLPKP